MGYICAPLNTCKFVIGRVMTSRAETEKYVMMDKELPAKIWIPVLAACALLPIIIFNGPVQRFDDGGDVGGGGDASGSDFAFPTQAPASDQMTMTVQPLQQPNEQPVTVPIDTQDLSTLLQQPYNDLVSGGPEPTFGKFAPPDMTGVSELFTPTVAPAARTTRSPSIQNDCFRR